jgi:RluA family pseudouridine synthase
MRGFCFIYTSERVLPQVGIALHGCRIGYDGAMSRPPRDPVPKIIRADDWLVLVDKPPGVLSVPGRGSAPTVLELLRKRRLIEHPEALLIVHRLDRDASGVMVLARTPEAQRRLTEIWAKRRVEKVYLALVRGYIANEGRISIPLLVDRDRGRVVPSAALGKPAVTAFSVVERLSGFTLVECRPETGRLHQIRVHLAGIGHPLAVDPRYGGAKAIFLSQVKPDYRPSHRRAERPLVGRLTLHAQRLAFEHPSGEGRICAESPIPRDMQAALTQLRRLAGSERRFRVADNSVLSPEEFS